MRAACDDAFAASVEISVVLHDEMLPYEMKLLSQLGRSKRCDCQISYFTPEQRYRLIFDWLCSRLGSLKQISVERPYKGIDRPTLRACGPAARLFPTFLKVRCLHLLTDYYRPFRRTPSLRCAPICI